MGIFLHIFHSSTVTNGHTNHKKLIVYKFWFLNKKKMFKWYDNFDELVDLAFWSSCIEMGWQSTGLPNPVLMVVNNSSQVLFLLDAPSLFPINLKWRKVFKNKSVYMNRKSVYVNLNPLLRHKFTCRLASRKKNPLIQNLLYYLQPWLPVGPVATCKKSQGAYIHLI